MLYRVVGKTIETILRRDNLQDLADKIGATYHGVLQHPSARSSQGYKYLPELLRFRDLVSKCMDDANMTWCNPPDLCGKTSKNNSKQQTNVMSQEGEEEEDGVAGL